MPLDLMELTAVAISVFLVVASALSAMRIGYREGVRDSNSIARQTIAAKLGEFRSGKPEVVREAQRRRF